MVKPQTDIRLYPLGRSPTGRDSRFTMGLVLDVADVLAKRGYPDFVASGGSRDYIELRQVLFQFLYGEPGRHTAGCSVWASPDCDCGGEQR